MFGGDGVLNIGNCLKSTVISNNKVRISDGVLSVGGHIGRLSHADYQDMTIEMVQQDTTVMILSMRGF